MKHCTSPQIHLFVKIKIVGLIRILEPTQNHQRCTTQLLVVMKNMAEHCTGYICSCFVVCFVFFLSFRFSCGVLYSTADHTVLLENDTISSVVHNSQTAWVVEFYSSFCGHCHAFAPTWKKLAKMAKGEFTNIDIYPQIEGYDDAKRFSNNEGIARDRSLKSDPSAQLLFLCLDLIHF